MVSQGKRLKASLRTSTPSRSNKKSKVTIILSLSTSWLVTSNAPLCFRSLMKSSTLLMKTIPQLLKAKEKERARAKAKNQRSPTRP